MGAWGNRNFENDQAMDFVGDFTGNPSLEGLEEALTTVIDLGEEGEYMEVDEASAALTAAEIIAATLVAGGHTNALTAKVAAASLWRGPYPPPLSP